MPGVEAAGAVEGGGQVQLAGHGEPDFLVRTRAGAGAAVRGARERGGTPERGGGPRAEPVRAGGRSGAGRDVSRAAAGERSAQPRHAADHTRPKSMWLRVTSGHEAFTASVDQGVRRFVNRRFRRPAVPGHAEGPAPPLGEQRRGGAFGAGR
ncbi:hypothetical protein GCM10010519_24500 [Streptomyces lactacystinicus]